MNYRSVKTKKLNGLLKVLIVFTIIFFILTVALPAVGSDLDEFEEAATTEKTEPKSDDNDDQDEKDEEDDLSLSLDEDDDNDSFLGSIFGGFIEAIIEVFFAELGEGAKMSLARVGQETETDAGEVEIRQTGDATLPFFQYDT